MKSNATVTIEGRELPRGVKLLRVLTICAVRVPIVRATLEQMPELAEAEGLINDGFFCGERTCIFIRSGQSRTQERDSINHEVGHAFVKLSGLAAVLAAVTTWPKGYEDLEETLVRIAAPHLGNAFTCPPGKALP